MITHQLHHHWYLARDSQWWTLHHWTHQSKKKINQSCMGMHKLVDCLENFRFYLTEKKIMLQNIATSSIIYSNYNRINVTIWQKDWFFGLSNEFVEFNRPMCWCPVRICDKWLFRCTSYLVYTKRFHRSLDPMGSPVIGHQYRVGNCLSWTNLSG